MYAKILVAVDESETSRHALQQAIELARKLSASVRMVHVLDMSWLPIGPEVAIDTKVLSAARRGVGENTIAAARDTARAAGFEAEAVLIETETPIQQVAETIAREAARWGADLLVMGTHGRRGFQHLMLGSVAEQTVRRSPGPVLLIPLPKGPPSA
ncbi:MAG: universal stress protein [Gammaproteobacteria bacterium]|nr:universal stress protein [Gammaproteobacteria bacterium]